MSENKQSGISKEDLLALIEKMGEQNREALRLVLEESKKPAPPTAKEAAQIKMQLEERATNGKAVLEKLERQRNDQKTCTHEHGKNDMGKTHVVWVHDNDFPGSTGYMYCQRCYARVRPEVFPDNRDWKKLDPGALFDTRLFNKLFQDTSQGEIISQ